MIVAVLFSLALAAEPQADPAVPAPVTVPAPAKPAKVDMKDPNRVICRREESVGSHRPVKTCMTKREWDLSEEQSRRVLKEGGTQAIAKPLDFGGVK